MPQPTVTLSQLANPFIGESIDLTLSFDNTGSATGFGPFVVLFLDKTGTDGAGSEIDDGLTFANASYLGSSITLEEIELTGNATETISAHGEDVDINVPAGFDAGDSLIVFELPFGSFVADQPIADISVRVDSSELADLNEPLNIAAQSGFIFGDTATGDNGEIIGNATSAAVEPQLVTLQKNYLGPEDETATGPNFTQQYEVVVSIAPGQEITDLDISDILPDTMQFVDVVSIVDVNGNDLSGSVNTDPNYFITPDDGGLGGFGTVGTEDNDVDGDNSPTPGGTVNRRINSVTGTGGRDVVMTVEFFVPRLDVDGDVIINADTGDDIFDQNQSELGNNLGDGNTWSPNDSRDDDAEVYIPRTANDATPDPADPEDLNGQTDTGFTGYGSDDDSGDEFNNPDEILEEQSIAIQKSVANVNNTGNFIPGDVLEYTIQFQVSDYFAFEDVFVEDLFSDGQRFDESFTPTLNFNEHGSSSTGLSFNFSGYSQVGDSGTGGTSNSGAADYLVIDETDINNPANSDGSGDTKLTFKVSNLLNDTAGQDNQLVGGGVPETGFQDGGATLNNNPPLNTGFGGTTGTITFRTIVQDTYSDNFPSGDASVDSADRLQNDAIIDGAVLDVDNLTANGNREVDDTSEELSIATGNLYKSIYAINGDIFSGANTDTNLSDGLTGYVSGVEVDPGDEITYRLTFELPVSDVEQLKLTDFFPLPAYDVNELAGLVFDTDRNNLTSVPLAGTSKYGPAHTFAQDPTSPEGGLSFDANANSFLYDFGTFDDPTNQSTVVDVLVTTTIQDEPIADGLVFTNQINQSQQNTFNEPNDRDAIVQINLRQPVVAVTKEVVGDSSNLEAGDVVSFSVTLDNTGGSEKGAFDVTIQDNKPAGFKLPGTGANVQVTYADGTPVAFTGDLFGAGIILEDDEQDPNKPYDDLGSLGNSGSGKESINITYSLELESNLSSIYNGTDSIIENTAAVTFANVEGGQIFPEVEGSATVEVATPEASKEIITTSEAFTNAEDVAIGEIVRYRLVAKIPEGTLESLTLRDRLPAGLTFLNDNTAKVGFVSTRSGISSSSVTASNIIGDETTLSSISSTDISVVLPDGAISRTANTNDDSYDTGTDVYFKLGDVTNAERDSNSEYAVVEFNALVDNNNLTNGSNDAGENRNNRVTLLSNDSAGALVEHNTSANVRVKIVEPKIRIDKQVEDPDNPGSFINTTPTSFVQADTNDVVTFRTTFTNAGSDITTAFEVEMSDVLPAGLTLDLSSINAVASNGTVVNLITSNSNGNTVIVNADELPVDQTITVTYSANISSLVTPEQLIVSPATVDYTSLSGTNGTVTNATGSSNTGTPGNINGERTGDSTATGGTANDYNISDDSHVKAPAIDPIKSIVSTSEASTLETDDGQSNPRDVTIGEIIRYRLTTQIPEGTIPDFQIKDVLPEGLRFLNDGTTEVAIVSNGGVSSDNANVPTTGTLQSSEISGDGGDGFDSGEDPIFSLGNITNADSDNDAETITIEFNAIVENVNTNQSGIALNNSFEVTSSAPSSTTQTSNVVAVEILEPVINNVNQTVNPNSGDGDDTVGFTVNFSNTGNNTAFDVSVSDTLATDKFDNLSNLQVTRGGTLLVEGTDYTNSSTATDLNIVLNQVGVNDVIELTYDADIIDTINPNFTINSTADVTYGTLPGTGTASNPTGSDNNNTSGSNLGERNGDDGVDGALNDYADSEGATVNTPGLNAVKSIVSTSEVSTAETESGDDETNGRDVTIGEVVRYRLVVELPEGEIQNLRLRDVLVGGLRYINDGSAKVALVADDANQISSSITIDSFAGNETSLDSIVPTTSITTPDGEATFDLGTINNRDDDTHDVGLGNTNNKEFAVLEFNAVVRNNFNFNQDGDALRNLFTASADNVNGVNSNFVFVEVLEPEITDVAKTAAPTTGDADDTVAFEVTFSNTGTTSAFDVVLTDDLAAGLDNLDFPNVAITRNGTPLVAGTDFVNTSTATDLNISINEVEQGDAIVVAYNADIINTIAPDYTIENTTDLTYSSLPGAGTPNNPTGSDTPGTPGGNSGERNGSNGETGIPNDYADSADSSISTPGLNPIKSIVTTSEAATLETGDGITAPRDLAIGEVVRYRLLVELPEGQIDNLQITDVLPEGLTYLDDGTAEVGLVADNPNLISSSIGSIGSVSGNQSNIDNVDITSPIAPIVTAAGDDTQLAFDLGTVLNNDNETLADNNQEYAVVEFNAIAANILSNQDGITLSDNFTVIHDGITQAVPSNAVTVAVVEPDISDVFKQASVEDADAGDEVSFTVTYSNTGNTTAFDVRLLDQPLDTELENIRSVVVSSSGSIDTVINNSSPSVVDVQVDAVAVGETITVTYIADLVTELVPGSIVTNTAEVTYTSLPETGTLNTSPDNATGSDTAVASGAADGERNGSDIDGVDDASDLNNYGNSSSDSINIISLSIGSTVFEDTNNNGVQNNDELGIDGVTLELYDNNNNPVLDNNNSPITTTTFGGGNYIFTQIPSGDYQIVIPASNFATGGALASNTVASQVVDLDDNQEDGDSNGSQLGGAATVVSSPVINLAFGTEPDNSQETEPNGTLDDNLTNSADTDGDLTVDFGFVPVGQIKGNVSADINNDGAGEDNLSGVTLTLVASDGATVATTQTDDDGNYTFANVLAGDYTVEQTQPAGYGDVAELDSINDGAEDTDSETGAANNILEVSLAAKEVDTGNDFIEVEFGSISGNVSTDTDNNDSGDRNLENVTVELLDINGDIFDTTLTDANGNYEFSNLFPGDYAVQQINLDNYGDVSEADSLTDGAADTDNETSTADNDNLLTVSLAAGETDSANNFVDEEYGIISGSINADTDNDDTGDSPLANVTVNLLDSAGAVFATTTTDADGNYEFIEITPGEYTIEQVNLDNYDNVSEADSLTDGAADTDNDANNNDNLLTVSLAAGETDSANNFIDEEYGIISGNVKSDDDNNDTGDTNLGQVTVELLDSNGAVVDTATTDADGNYEFTLVSPGDYQVRQTNLEGYGDVSDSDDGDLSLINVAVAAGEINSGNDFVDELGRISGNVKSDDDNNDTGDTNLENVTIDLLDNNGDVFATTVTDGDGNYEFANLMPGDYQVRETNLDNYSDVSELDSDVADALDGDTETADSDNDNLLNVSLTAGEADLGNDFIDEEYGIISGNVSADINNDDTGETNLENVTVNLLDSTGAVFATTTTDADGNYEFIEITPGEYTVEQVNLDNYDDINESDSVNDGAADTDNETSELDNDNLLTVSLAAGETDSANNFVDEEYGIISGSINADTNNDDAGDSPLANVTVNLLDSTGAVFATTTTDADGNYEFIEITPGEYTVEQVNLDNYDDINESDSVNDGAADTDNETSELDNDNLLSVSLAAGETDSANNFVDEEYGIISGNVTADINNDDTGETNLANVTVNLLDSTGAVFAATTTDADGNYEFIEITPGEYTIEQVNLDNYDDVSEADSLTDGAADTDNDANNNDNLLTVSLAAGETDNANNFIDEEYGIISGNVTADINNDDTGETNLENVTVNLLDSTEAVFATTTTDADGNYEFIEITPGEYTVEQVNLDNYSDVSEADSLTDGVADTDNETSELDNDNLLTVSLAAGETDSANNFVDEEYGIISGNVSTDTDNNDSGDVNLEQVTLELLNSNGDVVATTQTNADGNYEFTEVSPGNYQVRETNLDNYSDISELDSDVADALDGDTETADSDNDNLLNVSLTAGETDLGNDFIDEEYGIISGNVSADINNDDTGETNLENVTVNLLDSTGAVFATTTTDADGNYEFIEITPGEYTIEQVNLDNYDDISESDSLTDGVADTDNETSELDNDNLLTVSLAAGETDSANNFVDEEYGIISGNVSADINNDDTGETNLENVTVNLLDSTGAVFATTTTDADGNYEFIEITPGEYTVEQVNLDNYDDINESDSVNDGAADTDNETSELDNDNLLTVSLAAGETDSANNFVDEEYGIISGNVTADINNDDTGETNLENVTVNLLDSTGAVFATTTTDADGNYEFIEITPGEYTVQQVNLDNFGDVNDSDGDDPNAIAISLDAGETDSANNFVDEEYGIISGNVSADINNDDAGETNLANVTVNLLDSTGTNVSTTTTDGDGNYEFTEVSPGEYTVEQINLDNYDDINESDSVNDGAADTDNETSELDNDNLLSVSLAAGETDSANNFVDEEYGIISGNVSADTDNDDAGDSPLANVTVNLLDSTGAIVGTTTTNSDGEYEFPEITAGEYTVQQVNLDNFDDISEADSLTDGAADTDNEESTADNDNLLTVSLAAGETDSANNFVDEEYGIISGSVSADTDNDDAGDSPLANVTVNLLDSTGAIVGTTTTNSDGEYEFIEITPGEYTVEPINLDNYGDVSDSDGGDPNAISFTLNAGETNSGNEFIDQLGTISGQVSQDTTGDGLGDTPLENVSLTLIDQNGITIGTVDTDAQGNYSFNNLLPGVYNVTENQPDGLISLSENEGGDDDDHSDNGIINNITATVNPGEDDIDNNFIEVQPASVSGEVSEDTTGDGLGDAPLENVTLTLLAQDGTVVGTTNTDAQGNYSFNNLLPGVYNVTENQPDGLISLSENEGGDDDDHNDNGILNNITATVNPGENDTNNSFIDAVPAVISGRVWGDVDRNSIEGAFEPGLANVAVDLISDDNIIGSTVTDDNGEYQFTELIPGIEYQVAFDNTTFPDEYSNGLTTQNIGNELTDSDAEVGTGQTSLITLIPGELQTDIDAGLLTPEEDRIEGTASSDILVGTPVGETISGYKGQDTLTGGAGDDNFFYNETSDGVDIITDFTSGEDQMILTSIIEDELAYTGEDPIGDGYVVIQSYGSVGTMIQIDFDESDALLPKDVVFLQGVMEIDPTTDLVF